MVLNKTMSSLSFLQTAKIGLCRKTVNMDARGMQGVMEVINCKLPATEATLTLPSVGSGSNRRWL